MWLVSIILFASFAEAPLPSYEAVVSVRAWHRVNHLMEQATHLAVDEAVPTGTLGPESTAKYEEAMTYAKDFEREVMETAGLAYLQGLIWREMNETTKAEAALRRSLQLDPDGVDAWYDLGEVLTTKDALMEAASCFQQVSRLLPTGPDSWRGPLKEAEVAAMRGDGIQFEQGIREALRRGFSLQMIRGHENWKHYYRDPALHNHVDKLIRIFGDDALLQSLQEKNKPGK
jgi:tetratricopeptide (TPR) repeat protein